VRNNLGHGTVSGHKLDGLLGVIPPLRPQLPHPDLLNFRHRSLSSETTKNELAGRVEPMPRQRVDYLAPDALL
jgi:hypothetical protein